MRTQTRETLMNGACLAMFVFIGVLTSLGLLGVNPNVTSYTSEICKNNERQPTPCQAR